MVEGGGPRIEEALVGVDEACPFRLADSRSFPGLDEALALGPVHQSCGGDGEDAACNEADTTIDELARNGQQEFSIHVVDADDTINATPTKLARRMEMARQEEEKCDQFFRDAANRPEGYHPILASPSLIIERGKENLGPLQSSKTSAELKALIEQHAELVDEEDEDDAETSGMAHIYEQYVGGHDDGGAMDRSSDGASDTSAFTGEGEGSSQDEEAWSRARGMPGGQEADAADMSIEVEPGTPEHRTYEGAVEDPSSPDLLEGGIEILAEGGGGGAPARFLDTPPRAAGAAALPAGVFPPDVSPILPRGGGESVAAERAAAVSIFSPDFEDSFCLGSENGFGYKTQPPRPPAHPRTTPAYRGLVGGSAPPVPLAEERRGGARAPGAGLQRTLFTDFDRVLEDEEGGGDRDGGAGAASAAPAPRPKVPSLPLGAGGGAGAGAFFSPGPAGGGGGSGGPEYTPGFEEAIMGIAEGGSAGAGGPERKVCEGGTCTSCGQMLSDTAAQHVRRSGCEFPHLGFSPRPDFGSWQGDGLGGSPGPARGAGSPQPVGGLEGLGEASPMQPPGASPAGYAYMAPVMPPPYGYAPPTPVFYGAHPGIAPMYSPPPPPPPPPPPQYMHATPAPGPAPWAGGFAGFHTMPPAAAPYTPPRYEGAGSAGPPGSAPAGPYRSPPAAAPISRTGLWGPEGAASAPPKPAAPYRDPYNRPLHDLLRSGNSPPRPTGPGAAAGAGFSPVGPSQLGVPLEFGPIGAVAAVEAAMDPYGFARKLKSMLSSPPERPGAGYRGAGAGASMAGGYMPPAPKEWRGGGAPPKGPPSPGELLEALVRGGTGGPSVLARGGGMGSRRIQAY